MSHFHASCTSCQFLTKKARSPLQVQVHAPGRLRWRAAHSRRDRKRLHIASTQAELVIRLQLVTLRSVYSQPVTRHTGRKIPLTCSRTGLPMGSTRSGGPKGQRSAPQQHLPLPDARRISAEGQGVPRMLEGRQVLSQPLVSTSGTSRCQIGKPPSIKPAQRSWQKANN
jgi:hypothetical protein